MTSDVTISSALDYQQSTANSAGQLAEDFDDFLVLLTTQLQNQDPLSPMDSTEFTAQLVAFAGVEQQINANQKLNSLVSLSLGSSFSSALNYVGKDISYLSAEAYYDGTSPVKVNYAVSGDSVDTSLHIYDEEGTLVFTKDLSASSSTGNITWDGKRADGSTVDPGTYTVRVDALDVNNEALDTSTVVTGTVKGVETQNGTTFLLVGERAVSIGNIINVTQKDNTTTTTQTGSS